MRAIKGSAGQDPDLRAVVGPLNEVGVWTVGRRSAARISQRSAARCKPARKITVSTVAVGSDTRFLEQIARTSKGRYLAEDRAQVPQIFARETPRPALNVKP